MTGPPFRRDDNGYRPTPRKPTTIPKPRPRVSVNQEAQNTAASTPATPSKMASPPPKADIASMQAAYRALITRFESAIVAVPKKLPNLDGTRHLEIVTILNNAIDEAKKGAVATEEHAALDPESLKKLVAKHISRARNPDSNKDEGGESGGVSSKEIKGFERNLLIAVQTAVEQAREGNDGQGARDDGGDELHGQEGEWFVPKTAAVDDIKRFLERKWTVFQASVAPKSDLALEAKIVFDSAFKKLAAGPDNDTAFDILAWTSSQVNQLYTVFPLTPRRGKLPAALAARIADRVPDKAADKAPDKVADKVTDEHDCDDEEAGPIDRRRARGNQWFTPPITKRQKAVTFRPLPKLDSHVAEESFYRGVNWALDSMSDGRLAAESLPPRHYSRSAEIKIHLQEQLGLVTMPDGKIVRVSGVPLNKEIGGDAAGEGGNKKDKSVAGGGSKATGGAGTHGSSSGQRESEESSTVDSSHGHHEEGSENSSVVYAR